MNNLAAIKMREINGLKMHINLFLIWISGLVCVCGDREEKTKKLVCFSLQPFMFIREIKTDGNSGRKRGRAASSLSKRLSGLR